MGLLGAHRRSGASGATVPRPIKQLAWLPWCPPSFGAGSATVSEETLSRLLASAVAYVDGWGNSSGSPSGHSSGVRASVAKGKERDESTPRRKRLIVQSRFQDNSTLGTMPNPRFGSRSRTGSSSPAPFGTTTASHSMRYFRTSSDSPAVTARTGSSLSPTAAMGSVVSLEKSHESATELRAALKGSTAAHHKPGTRLPFSHGPSVTPPVATVGRGTPQWRTALEVALGRVGTKQEWGYDAESVENSLLYCGMWQKAMAFGTHPRDVVLACLLQAEWSAALTIYSRSLSMLDSQWRAERQERRMVARAGSTSNVVSKSMWTADQGVLSQLLTKKVAASRYDREEQLVDNSQVNKHLLYSLPHWQQTLQLLERISFRGHTLPEDNYGTLASILLQPRHGQQWAAASRCLNIVGVEYGLTDKAKEHRERGERAAKAVGLLAALVANSAPAITPVRTPSHHDEDSVRKEIQVVPEGSTDMTPLQWMNALLALNPSPNRKDRAAMFGYCLRSSSWDAALHLYDHFGDWESRQLAKEVASEQLLQVLVDSKKASGTDPAFRQPQRAHRMHDISKGKKATGLEGGSIETSEAWAQGLSMFAEYTKKEIAIPSMGAQLLHQCVRNSTWEGALSVVSLMRSAKFKLPKVKAQDVGRVLIAHSRHHELLGLRKLLTSLRDSAGRTFKGSDVSMHSYDSLILRSLADQGRTKLSNLPTLAIVRQSLLAVSGAMGENHVEQALDALQWEFDAVPEIAAIGLAHGLALRGPDEDGLSQFQSPRHQGHGRASAMVTRSLLDRCIHCHREQLRLMSHLDVAYDTERVTDLLSWAWRVDVHRHQELVRTRHRGRWDARRLAVHKLRPQVYADVDALVSDLVELYPGQDAVLRNIRDALIEGKKKHRFNLSSTMA